MTNEEKQEALTQEFEKYPELTADILYLYENGKGFNLIWWGKFLANINAALKSAALNKPPVCVGGELLPCPFCGGTDIAFEDAVYNGIGHTRCANCFASGPEEMNPDGHAKAAKAWNTRALTAQQPVRGEALAEMRAILGMHPECSIPDMENRLKQLHPEASSLGRLILRHSKALTATPATEEMG